MVSARCLKSKWPESVPAGGWRPFSFVVGWRKGIGRIKKKDLVSNCHSGQVVSARCLKSKWPGSVPAGGWSPFSFVVGRKKGFGKVKTRSCQQLQRWSSGKCKVFEVLSGQDLCLWLAPF